MMRGKLDALLTLAEGTRCRRASLLSYFGEELNDGRSEPREAGSVGAATSSAGATEPALPGRRRSAPSGGSAVREATSVGVIFQYS